MGSSDILTPSFRSKEDLLAQDFLVSVPVCCWRLPHYLVKCLSLLLVVSGLAKEDRNAMVDSPPLPLTLLPFPTQKVGAEGAAVEASGQTDTGGPCSTDS